MPVQSVYLLSSRHEVVFHKCFGVQSDIEAKIFAYLQKRSVKYFLIDENHVLLDELGAYIIVLVGTREVDGIILEQLAECIKEILKRLLDNRIHDVSLMLQPDLNTKFGITLNEVAPQGIIEDMNDVDFAISMTKLKK